MPQVPTLQNQVSPRAAPDTYRRPLDTGVEALGQGIQQAGNILHDVQLEERRKADRAALIDAKVQLSNAEQSLLYDPQNGALTKQGKNAFDLPGQTMPEYDKRASEITQGLKNNRQKTAFSELLADSKTKFLGDLNRYEDGQREKFYDETDEALVESSIQSAARHASEPDRIAADLVTQQATIAGMAKRKGWDTVQTERAQRQFESKLHEAVVGDYLVKDDYAGARRYLAQSAGRMEDPAVETLQRRIAIEEDGAFSRQQRQQKLFADAAAKDGDRLLAEGKLTSAWIEQHRNILDGSDYRYFYQKLKGGDEGSGPRDTTLYADLRTRAGNGEDVRDDARDALQRGAIRSSDFDRITSEVESERPGWYKRGTQFITTSAAVSDLNPDPAAAQRLAQMRDDWQEWADAHPKATDTEARTAYENIVHEYAIINLQNFTLTKRAPQFLAGSRNAPDMAATAAATVKAYQEGRIDKDEFERQALLIKEWNEALKFQNANKQKAPPK